MEQLLNEIETLTPKDKVLVEGTWRQVAQYNNKTLAFRDPNKYWVQIKEDTIEMIEEVEKYSPKIYFEGSAAYINSYALDGSGNCYYMDLVGQEQHVRSITAMIMQGMIKTKNSSIYCDEIDFFRIIQAGNKRVIQSLGDGIAHSILYNKNSIVAQEHNMLIGNTEEKIYKRFLKWLRVSMKFPVYNKYNEVLFQRLKDSNLIFKTISYNIISYEISKQLMENDCAKFKETVIEILKDNNEIDLEQSIQVPIIFDYPNSKYLTPKQVEDIYEKLKTLPEPYSTDGQKIKPVGIKLFGPSMTYYVVESNKGDEWYQPFERCFGYVENLSAPDCSEWGYFSIPEILKASIPIRIMGQSQGFNVGYEMDLFFNDKFIDRNGNILNKEDL